MTFLLFAVALSLSAVAAYYAIFGLMAIFAGATIPIAIMGGLLECSKLTVASWLYQNWKQIPKLFKTYFLIALIILMMLTSMGIFGYLSKAHLDQAVPTGDIQAKLSLIEEKIKQEEENIDASRKELNQLDAQVNETISRSGNTKDTTGNKAVQGVERSIAIRKSQQKDRARILGEIGTAQTKISKLQEERAPIASQVRKVEAEVGPIKYIAALIYGDTINSTLLEKAVRIVIIMIVAVFDPLAVLLLVAANWNLKNHRLPKQEEKREEKVVEIFEKSKEVSKKEDLPLPPATKPEPKSDPEPLAPEPLINDTEDAPLNMEIDESDKDWEPELYNKEKELGRYLEEVQGIQTSKTKSFLNKIKSVYKEPIEKQIEDLQSPNT